MQFTAETALLQQALARVLGAVERRSTMPILSHVRVTATMRGAVEFLATDLEIFAAAECAAGIPDDGFGSICLPAARLKGALDACPEDQVEVTRQENGEVLIASGVARFTLAALPPDDFPQMPDSLTVDCILPPGLLGRIHKAVGHAVGQDQQKYNLCGIYLACEEAGRLTAAAADGHRLSVASRDIAPAYAFAPGILLPAKAARVVSGIYGALEYSCGKDRVLHFNTQGARVSSRMIDGEFPDYRRVIPKNLPFHILVDSEALSQALEACGVVIEGKSKGVTLEACGDQLTVSALGSEGKVTVTVPCDGDEGFKTMVSATYLLQALKALSGEVFIKFGPDLGPLLIIPVDHQGWDERLEVVMPMRI